MLIRLLEGLFALAGKAELSTGVTFTSILPMMYFSTDYVFDGEGEIPWKEYDERHPLNVYGLTKYESELEVEQY